MANKIKTRQVKCMTYTMLSLNLIVIVLAVLAIIITVINIRAKRIDPHDKRAMSTPLTSFVITVGTALLIAAVIGIAGVCRQNTKLLYIYAGILIALIILELFVVIGASAFYAMIAPSNPNLMRQHFFLNITTENELKVYNEIWDRTQIEFNCCGVDGPKDYKIARRDVPVSCCPKAHPLIEGLEKKKLHQLCLTESSYYPEGCEKAVADALTRADNFYWVVGVVFCVLEMVCASISIWMGNRVKTERKKLHESLQSHFET